MVKLLSIVIKIVGAVLRIMLASTVIFIFLQVFFRYVLHTPLTWSEQLSRFMFIWTMSLGLPVLFYKKDFMAFDLLQDSIPEPWRSILIILIKCAVTFFAVFWLHGSVSLIGGTMNKMTSGVKIPISLLYSAQTLASLLIVWVMATQIIQDIFAASKHSGKKGGGR